MSEIFRINLLVLWFCVGVIASAGISEAREPVSFDVPGILPGTLIDVDSSANTDTIQVNVPVSLLLKDSNGILLDELLVAVYWSSNPNLVCDFQPKTILTSDVDGSIAIQQSSEKNGSVGVDSKGGYPGVADVSGQLKFGGSNRETTSFQKLPQQTLLAASGYIKRGTGVYFKFRASTQTTLEGTHELSINFKVPKHWRAGLIRVDCQVKGKRPGSFDSSNITSGNEFISAVHLSNDSLAYDMAMTYVEHENRLFQLRNYKEPQPSKGLFAQLESLVETKKPTLPENWFRMVVYTNSENAFKSLQRQLPESLQQATSDFVAAKKQFAGLHR